MHKRHYVVLAATLGPALPALATDADAVPFNADVGNFIITLLIFGTVVYLLGKLAWRPLLNVLHEREDAIRGQIESAQKERAEAAKLLDEYKQQVANARAEATALVEEGRRDAEQVGRKIQEEARAESDRLLERARREIRVATESAVKELYDQTADLAVRVAGNIIRKEVSPSSIAN